MTFQYSKEYIDTAREIYKALYYNDTGSKAWWSFGDLVNYTHDDVRIILGVYGTLQSQQKIVAFNPYGDYESNERAIEQVQSYSKYDKTLVSRTLTQLYWFVQSGKVAPRWLYVYEYSNNLALNNDPSTPLKNPEKKTSLELITDLAKYSFYMVLLGTAVYAYANVKGVVTIPSRKK
jgi:hypothetical protein